MMCFSSSFFRMITPHIPSLGQVKPRSKRFWRPLSSLCLLSRSLHPSLPSFHITAGRCSIPSFVTESNAHQLHSHRSPAVQGAPFTPYHRPVSFPFLAKIHFGPFYHYLETVSGYSLLVFLFLIAPSLLPLLVSHYEKEKSTDSHPLSP